MLQRFESHPITFIEGYKTATVPLISPLLFLFFHLRFPEFPQIFGNLKTFTTHAVSQESFRRLPQLGEQETFRNTSKNSKTFTMVINHPCPFLFFFSYFVFTFIEIYSLFKSTASRL